MLPRFSLFAGLALALSLGLCAPARAKEPARAAEESAFQISGRKSILAAHARIDNARAKSDIPAIMDYIAPDFRFYSIARIEQDRAAYERVQTVFARFSNGKPATGMRVKTSVNNWQWRGPDAVIYTTLQFDASAKDHSLSGTVRQREYWGKTARGWQLRQIVEIMAQMTMDGETIEM